MNNYKKFKKNIQMKIFNKLGKILKIFSIHNKEKKKYKKCKILIIILKFVKKLKIILLKTNLIITKIYFKNKLIF